MNREQRRAARRRTDRGVRVGLSTAAGSPCLLCGRPPDTAAVFVPSKGRRIFFYSLCSVCSSQDRQQAAVAAEAEIARRVPS